MEMIPVTKPRTGTYKSRQSSGQVFTWTTWRPGYTMKDVVVNAILSCLRLHNGNKTYAAVSLGMSLRSVRQWVGRDERLAEFRIKK